MRWLTVLIAVVLLAGGAEAQPRRRQGPLRPAPNPGILERLERMSPEQRRRALDRLPPERRARVEERLRAWERLSPPERRRLREQYNRFRQLSPEEQEEARELFRRFQSLPVERRRAIRQEVFRLRSLDDAGREKRLARYRPEERDMIERMLDLAP